MHRDIRKRADQSGIVLDMHVDLWTRELYLLKGCLHLRVPLLHKSVDVRHILCIIYCRRRTRLMKVIHAVNPARHFLRFFISVFNRVDVNWRCSDNVLTLYVLQLKHCFVFVVQSRFVQYRNTQILLGSIGFWHF